MTNYDLFGDFGRMTIRANGKDLIGSVGVDGIKDIVRNVYLGGNVRDITEFITQKRLFSSYASMTELFVKHLGAFTDNPVEYNNMICNDYRRSKLDGKVLDLWLLGLTRKGLDNIVRDKAKLYEYGSAAASCFLESVSDLEKVYGPISGSIKMGGKEIEINLNFLLFLFLSAGAQTLTIRGSAKSMNGKFFEKIILGTFLTIMGFEYRATEPKEIDKTKKIFWLSNMDENERVFLLT